MLLPALIVALDCALLLAIVVFREPKLLLPLVILGLPIEYFGTEALGALGEGGISGAVRALLNPGKAAMLVTILAAAVRSRHDPRALIPDSAVIVPIVLLLSVFVLGVLWSDSLKAPNSVLILPMYVAFVFVAPSFIDDRKDVERILVAFLVAAALLALLAIAQRIGGVFNWRTILVQSDDYSYRSNATFADPNNLARYFAITMSLAAGLVLTTGPRRLTLYVAIPTWVISAAAIVATASRSGWLMLLLCTFLVVLVSPIRRWTKFRLVAGSSAALAVMLTLLLLQGGTDAERVRSLASGVQVIGQREFLIKAGWAMFKDSPLVGVGSGNYQNALVTSYLYLVPDWARTTLSHTSLVSILAELGLVGAAAFIFATVRIALTVVRTYYRSTLPEMRLLVGWLGISILGIVLHSQSEGRLIDEPYLWVLLSLFVAIETGRVFVTSPVAETVPVAEEAPPALALLPEEPLAPAPRGPFTLPAPE